jgi:plasmid stabilization system protein ParE
VRIVDFTKKANKRFQEIQANIREPQSPKAAPKFTEDFKHVIGLVQENPEMFETSNDLPTLRRRAFYQIWRFFLQSF